MNGDDNTLSAQLGQYVDGDYLGELPQSGHNAESTYLSASKKPDRLYFNYLVQWQLTC